MGPLRRLYPLVSPGYFIRHKAMTQGFLGDSRFWQFVGVLIFGHRLLRKILGSDPQTVAVERLELGQTIILAAIRRKR